MGSMCELGIMINPWLMDWRYFTRMALNRLSFLTITHCFCIQIVRAIIDLCRWNQAAVQDSVSGWGCLFVIKYNIVKVRAMLMGEAVGWARKPSIMTYRDAFLQENSKMKCFQLAEDNKDRTFIIWRNGASNK